MRRGKQEQRFATSKRDFATLPNCVALANDGFNPQGVGLVGLANDFFEADDGWWRIASYGETEHRGNGETFIQVFNHAIANEVATNFKMRARELANKVKGSFSRPFYVGHPDCPFWCRAKPWAVDTKAYGWFDDMEAREDGLYVKPRMSEPGKVLLANSHFRYLSPRWLIRKLSGNRVAPTWVTSVGFTNDPNMVGDAIANEDINQNTEMNELLKKLLGLVGLSNEQVEAIANEVSDAPTTEQVLEKANALVSAKTEAEEALANEMAEHETTKAALQTKADALVASEEALANEQTALANERAELVNVIADNAVYQGKVTFAERTVLANELTQDFEGRMETLSAQKPAMKTQAVDKDFSQKPDASGQKDDVLALANEYIEKNNLDSKNPESLNSAFAYLRKTKPDLF